MIRVRRWLDSSKVREMCIRYNYYTRGDCRAYDKMLASADNLDANDLEAVKQIAVDIIDHSNMTSEDTCSAYDYFCNDGYKEDIEGVMYGLLSECTEMYVEMDRSDV